MKKFAQTAVLVAGLVGLSACASSDTWTPYGSRTAGSISEGTVSDTVFTRAGNSDALNVCLERENRLMAMNKSCYRK